ncbi:4'-phosphopantetheinyl transferase A [Penicillium hispanicum]|uniref:4'-phosphopantetheinyl transferase A n=1 Tax=Penicillium hispanicum TaxID=1080232 RepID=UPI0025418EE0|nr:4'-phosphopantetheinyl transferase A [Penicillium hispanicum]KAJ5591571.1 4'-phosphopantetheinyl transferase A [Penicillium hispanicum]
MAANEISLNDAVQNNVRVLNVDPCTRGFPTLARWYIDIREWEAHGLDLPLLNVISPAEQEAVKRFHHAADKRMSLASHLLKYLYIHHACGVPWKDIVLTRTALPENRPYFKCPSGPHIDFNVSHQAGLTILAGTIAVDQQKFQSHATEGIPPLLSRLGIDVTCVNEHRRKRLTTYEELVEFVSIFSEVFSDRELSAMKNPLSTLRQARDLGLAKAFPEPDTPESIARFGVRLFYSYWALKEAYLKMTGDALLAPWVRTLEFTNVIPPDPVELLPASKPYGQAKDQKHIPQSPKNWGPPYKGVKITMGGRSIDDVRIQLAAFESDYIVATAGRGPPVGPIPQESEAGDQHHLPGQIKLDSGDQTQNLRIPIHAKKVVGDMDPWHVPFAITDPWLPMQEIDIELDVRACAEGRCVHDDNHRYVLSSRSV